MSRNETSVSAAGSLLLVTVLLNAIVLQSAFTAESNDGYWVLFITLPLMVVALSRMKKSRIRQYSRYTTKRLRSRGANWYRLLRHRPRHYFTGLPPGESVLKPQPPATGRSSKKRPVKPAIRKPVKG